MKDFLKNEMCKPSGEKLSSLVCSICNKPGKFGIKRGRADAAMTWHYPSSERGAKYTEKTISQAKLSLMNSQLIGVSSVSGKDHAKLDDASLSGALLEATAGGGATHKHRVLPKHKSTLKRFFKREN
ncbi:MAG: hypothetical protein U9O87_04845 [Verrucomicrobiota bacterium]|nr:hypothetical protein [Verrucomicrobiota bacterium]